MRPAEIERWNVCVQKAQGETSIYERKRRYSEDRGTHLPSPPIEDQDRDSDRLAMSTSPKRQRVGAPGEESNVTPRARRTVSAFDGAEELHGSAPPSSPSKESSSISRSSSPTKQIANAQLQPTGFNRASFTNYVLPASLQPLVIDLRRIEFGHGLLPASLRGELTENDGVFHFAFADNDNIFPSQPGSQSFQYPPLQRVRLLIERAEDCETYGLGESSWNMEVHGPILEWLLRDAPGSDGPLDYRYCTTAGIVPEYRPINAPSTMIDFCLAIKVDPETKRTIDNLRRVRPGLSISHTDWGDLDHRPIAISMETKAEPDYRRALLQVGTWHAAQWRSLRYGGAVPQQIEFLAGIIVLGHDWSFVATVLSPDGKPTLLEKLPIGTTESVMGIYRLFASLHSLRMWGETVFWPAFHSDVLGSS